MNENRITNIIERGGVDNWNTVSLFSMFMPLMHIGFRPFNFDKNIRIWQLWTSIILRSESRKVLFQGWSSSRVVINKWWQKCGCQADKSLCWKQGHHLWFPVGRTNEQSLQNHSQGIQNVPLLQWEGIDLNIHSGRFLIAWNVCFPILLTHWQLLPLCYSERREATECSL